ncbi:helix-turn-helix transcriptional regulator [Actinacidiphila rubida]|uniref:AraC-type DNA-binding protein n=1 Tax=Actinacidiphila rubida TaxID=310780 RepID=A0A1H8JI06_9ACTN|nr:helix-turn-helix transcriptional regulator [Actinacidiphila rubida]SEN79848.1 AraC-type DNA-binding protein [Actinacidiphila rubida]
MTADGGSSGADERETANASATTTGKRRRPPAVRRPGMRARRRPRGTERPAVPEGTSAAPLVTRTAGHPADRRHIDLWPVRLSLVEPPARPGATEVAGPYAEGVPRTWHLVFATRGPLVVEPERRVVRLESGSVMLWEPAAPTEPLHLSACTAAGPPAHALVLHLPEAALAVTGEALRDLSGRPVPTGSGPAALLASFVHALAAHTPAPEVRHGGWLGSAAVNLVTAFLDSETGSPQDTSGPQPLSAAAEFTPSATDVLLREIKTHIERHLGDPDLSPTAIAAAAHISVRYLHHLFQRDGRTVGAFLRERRLEHCRAELSDPAHAGRGVCEIGRRWGFRDPAVFNRTFKSAYGVTPGAFRTERLRPGRRP